MLNYYQLNRKKDHSGNSGTGVVAHAIELPEMGVVLIWDGENEAKISSVVIYSSVEDLIKIHGHGGDSELVKIAPEDVDFEKMHELIGILDSAQDKLVFICNELFELENPEEEEF